MSKTKAQLKLLLTALEHLRAVYPDDVEAYCQAVIAVAKAAGVEPPE